jgi:hypothetical protein
MRGWDRRTRRTPPTHNAERFKGVDPVGRLRRLDGHSSTTLWAPTGDVLPHDRPEGRPRAVTPPRARLTHHHTKPPLLLSLLTGFDAWMTQPT